ncbi:helix-turn-helix domain-containing protein [Maribellus maritimus]|uniref:helix-turn-helix domain-containing protein n=1 Tax=Maribellus maritimus TaxID=2870838 RepID=UPI001EEB8686|nr:helix-turn-helix transcriptional regulator [Maribellus maritimus]MCG6187775.1 helix-turn-helix domain-containing protein [Maribellus maritimus]
MKERIQKFIDYKGIAAGELASVLEVQRSNISHILNGRNKPGASLIEKMLVVFPELNARWLLTGEGSMIEKAEEQLVKSEAGLEERTQNKSTQHSNYLINNNNNKQIDKIVLLYNDGTFVSYNK